MAAKLAPSGPLAAVGLLPLVVLLLCGVSFPGLWAWSGPALGVLGAACFLATMWGWRPKALTLFIPVVLVAHLGAAARVQQTVGAEGDEPHYLMVAESLLRDGDLALEPDYAEKRYAPFYRKPDLAPHYRVRGRDGEILSLHAIGLSLLLLPAYGLGGYPAASFFMALLSVALAVEIRGLIREQIGDSTVADAAAWVAALSPPILHYSGLIFTEIPAALVVAIVLRRGREPWKLWPPAAAGLATACAFPPVVERSLRSAHDHPAALPGGPAGSDATRRPRGARAHLRGRSRDLPPDPLRLLGPPARLRQSPRVLARGPARGNAGPAPRPGVRAARLRSRFRPGRPGRALPRQAEPSRHADLRGARCGRLTHGRLVAHVARRVESARPLPGSGRRPARPRHRRSREAGTAYRARGARGLGDLAGCRGSLGPHARCTGIGMAQLHSSGRIRERSSGQLCCPPSFSRKTIAIRWR